MLNKKIISLILGCTFVLALVFFALYLKPRSQVTLQPEEQAVQVESTTKNVQTHNVSRVDSVEDEIPIILENESVDDIATLSESLKAVKNGTKSILTVIFSNEDLNQQLNDLLALSENGETWADYAIGQLAEMCTYLYQTPETSLIAMFSGARAASSPEQQAQMSQLLPVVVNASQRCKTLDEKQLKALGESRDWFDKAAEAKEPNAFVISGYSLLSNRLLAESEEYANALDEKRSEIGRKIRQQARQDFQTQMREFIVNGKTNPETIISMSEHLNLFYEDGHPLKQKEAWMLLACEQGYENNCSSTSTAMSVFCMFDSSCATGGDFKQGVLWSQGQYKLDEYQRIADELRLIFDTQDWDKLGF